MIGYLFYPTEETGYDLSTTHPNIAAWVARMRALEGWQDPYDLMPGQRIAPRSS
jgi:glutathione S-transferase